MQTSAQLCSSLHGKEKGLLHLQKRRLLMQCLYSSILGNILFLRLRHYDHNCKYCHSTLHNALLHIDLEHAITCFKTESKNQLNIQIGRNIHVLLPKYQYNYFLRELILYFRAQLPTRLPGFGWKYQGKGIQE